MTKQQLWSVPAELKLEVMRGTKSVAQDERNAGQRS